ncbi:hypothetical protein C0Z20_00945 [Trinickia symbiotica]|uniref:Uncharacterized protein n=1 Tax=Trinickia symbiotica TaxID=863227 RepID=A0A2N7XAR6_9BURK|nr:hypothetical protein C0Z20_00945 [Trinickia symbiotica]
MFRTGDRVVIEASEEFYAYVDGWQGRIAVLGPKAPNACHSQVPAGYALVECERGEDTPAQLLVPFDQLRLSV